MSRHRHRGQQGQRSPNGHIRTVREWLAEGANRPVRRGEVVDLVQASTNLAVRRESALEARLLRIEAHLGLDTEPIPPYQYHCVEH